MRIRLFTTILLSLAFMSSVPACKQRTDNVSDTKFSDGPAGSTAFDAKFMDDRSWCYVFNATILADVGAYTGMAHFRQNNAVDVSFRGHLINGSWTLDGAGSNLGFKWNNGDAGLNQVSWVDNKRTTNVLGFDQGRLIELYQFGSSSSQNTGAIDLAGKGFCVAGTGGLLDIGVVKFFAPAAQPDGTSAAIFMMRRYDGGEFRGSWRFDGANLTLDLLERDQGRTAEPNMQKREHQWVPLNAPETMSWNFIGKLAPQTVVSMKTTEGGYPVTAVKAN
jgi:hypothetical protein